MNKINQIFDFRDKKRTHIEDSYQEISPEMQMHKDALNTSKRHIGDISYAIWTFRQLEKLLDSPTVQHDPKKHIRAKMQPESCFNDKCLVIIYSVETNEPISAHFEDAE